MIAEVSLFPRCMDANICGYAVLLYQSTRKRKRQFSLLQFCQLCWQGYFPFSCHFGIFSFLGSFREIPEF